MPRYEYKVVPAPTKGLKAKGLKTPEARFSHAIQTLMNQLAGEGWEYQRAETLPSIERSGLTSTTTEWRNVLVFRRLREDDAEAFTPDLLSPPAPVAQAAEEADATPADPRNGADTAEETPPAPEAEKPQDDPAPETQKATDNPDDNGVEDTGDVKGIGASLMSLASHRGKAKSDS